jgi:hypothetical protein
MDELEAEMAALEDARAAYEAQAQRVSGAITALEAKVADANDEVQRSRNEVSRVASKRRRLSGSAGGGASDPPAADFTGGQMFADTAVVVEKQLQAALRQMARVSSTTRSVRAAVDDAKVQATQLLGSARLATAREARNTGCSNLLRMLGRVDLGGSNAEAVFGQLSVVQLHQMGGVCRAFRRWTRAALAALPRPLAVGGAAQSQSTRIDTPVRAVEVLSLATMRWAVAPAITVPQLPTPRAWHVLVASAQGQVTVVGGISNNPAPHQEQDVQCKQALRWSPGQLRWEALPSLSIGRMSSAAVLLPDGRLMLLGGNARMQDGTPRSIISSVEVLQADGHREWRQLAPMGTPRTSCVAGLLPSGHVIVAGGKNASGVLQTAELWDPMTDTWSALPPMGHARSSAAACVLPSGRFAVVGGRDGVSARQDGEVFDPVRRMWVPMPDMSVGRASHCATKVCGGMVVIGGVRSRGNEPAELGQLFDEASGRWFSLPHSMVTDHERKFSSGKLVSLPSAVLESPTAATGL